MKPFSVPFLTTSTKQALLQLSNENLCLVSRGVTATPSKIVPAFCGLPPSPGQGQQEGNWTWLHLWNLLTINLKDKCFHHFKDWLGFIFKCVSHHGRGKYSEFQCPNYTPCLTHPTISKSFMPFQSKTT